MVYNLNLVNNIFETIVDIAGRQLNLQNGVCQKLKANYDRVLWDKLNDSYSHWSYLFLAVWYSWISNKTNSDP